MISEHDNPRRAKKPLGLVEALRRAIKAQSREYTNQDRDIAHQDVMRATDARCVDPFLRSAEQSSDPFIANYLLALAVHAQCLQQHLLIQHVICQVFGVQTYERRPLPDPRWAEIDK